MFYCSLLDRGGQCLVRYSRVRASRVFNFLLSHLFFPSNYLHHCGHSLLAQTQDCDYETLNIRLLLEHICISRCLEHVEIIYDNINNSSCWRKCTKILEKLSPRIDNTLLFMVQLMAIKVVLIVW